MVVGEVEEILESETSVLYNIIVDGERIKTTKGHPFYLKDKGWVKASDLEVGDILVTDDEEVEVLQILIEYLAEPITVYNFTVKQYHNYFVTDLEVLTHNINGKCEYDDTNSAFLDNNTVFGAIYEGDMNDVDIALNGRKPLISDKVLDEFLVKGNGDDLLDYLNVRNGDFLDGSNEKDVKRLFDELDSYNSNLPYQSKKNPQRS